MPGRAYQVRGRPGTGKTLLGWHFLVGRGVHDQALLVTFDEPAEQLRFDARRFGFDAESVRILDLSPTSSRFSEQEGGDLVLPSDIEQRPIAEAITEVVEEMEPARIVIDSMSHFRYLSADAAQHRNRALAFLRYLKERQATVLLLSEHSEENLHFLSDGIIELDRGEHGRTIQVLKQRGSDFRSGAHSISIDSDGMRVHPMLDAADVRTGLAGDPAREMEILSSGVPEVDELLGGGIEAATVTIISGTSGVGKTTLGLQFIREAAAQDRRSVVFSFEEETRTMVRRSHQVGIPVEGLMERGTLTVHQHRPWSFDMGSFAAQIRREVEQNNAEIVMLDSLAGYQECGESSEIRAQVHRVCKYLISRDVTVLLINELRDVTGAFRATDQNVSHLADNLVFLRYLEMNGGLRKAIGVLKKRAGDFEKTLREFRIGAEGIEVGEPLTQLRGILTGTPDWGGDPRDREAPMHVGDENG